MKIKVSTEIIDKYNPCKDRFDNWKAYYCDWSGDAAEFLKLENITHGDKLWVILRLVPKNLLEVFAIDCALAAERHAAAYAAAYAADAYADAYAAAAYAAAYAADADAERKQQLEILAWLIETEEE